MNWRDRLALLFGVATPLAFGHDPAVAAPPATLEVNPRQAELVQLGMQMGNLSLSLRPLSGESDTADESNSSRQDESVIVAEAVDESADSKKVKQEKGNSYVVDKDLRFMVEDRAKSKPGVTVLRGTAEK